MASFLNIVFDQKNITELTQGYKLVIINIQEKYTLKFWPGPNNFKNTEYIIDGINERIKQTITWKQDLAYLISRRNSFFLVRFSSFG